MYGIQNTQIYIQVRWKSLQQQKMTDRPRGTFPKFPFHSSFLCSPTAKPGHGDTAEYIYLPNYGGKHPLLISLVNRPLKTVINCLRIHSKKLRGDFIILLLGFIFRLSEHKSTGRHSSGHCTVVNVEETDNCYNIGPLGHVIVFGLRKGQRHAECGHVSGHSSSFACN